MVLPSEPTIEIVDPDKPGDFLVISARDFDPAKHRRRGERKAVPEKAPVTIEVDSPMSRGLPVTEPADDDDAETPDRPRRGRPPRARE